MLQCGLQMTGPGTTESEFDSQESGISLLPLQQDPGLEEATLQNSQSMDAQGSPDSDRHRQRLGS